MLKTMPAWSLFKDGIVNSLILVAGALAATLMFALVLGAVFYGLNNSSTGNQASTAPTTQTAQQTAPANPAAPPGMRDVTPKANSEPGTTTGAAPARPAAPQPATPRTDNSSPKQ